jgi:ketosteroid isomerase-like protein
MTRKRIAPRCAPGILRALCLLGVAGAAFLSSPPAAHGGGLGADSAAVLDADQAFARLSRQQGVRAAFLAYMADDAVLFRPGPVSGRAYLAAQPASPPPRTELIWAPVHVGVAGRGDLGYTSGPYELRATDRTHTVREYGWYVTLWRKQPDGSWKFILDQGVVTPPPSGSAAIALAAAAASPAAAAAQSSPGGGEGSAARPPAAAAVALPPMQPGGPEEAVVQADRDFAGDIAAHGARAAYQARLTPSALLLRDNAAAPLDARIAGRDAVAKAAGAAAQPPATGEPLGAGLSQAGDFGYTYGTTSGPAAGTSGGGAMYLRIWGRRNGDTYGIAVDLVKPLPPAVTPPGATPPTARPPAATPAGTTPAGAAAPAVMTSGAMPPGATPPTPR